MEMDGADSGEGELFIIGEDPDDACEGEVEWAEVGEEGEGGTRRVARSSAVISVGWEDDAEVGAIADLGSFNEKPVWRDIEGADASYVVLVDDVGMDAKWTWCWYVGPAGAVYKGGAFSPSFEIDGLLAPKAAPAAGPVAGVRFPAAVTGSLTEK
ncbi:hypothetical protein HDV00_002737 [Rhizophlyctis rosea]|nr:hypothetical protein HDV00_002737 [Rhizophlyctis rosea]